MVNGFSTAVIQYDQPVAHIQHVIVLMVGYDNPFPFGAVFYHWFKKFRLHRGNMREGFIKQYKISFIINDHQGLQHSQLSARKLADRFMVMFLIDILQGKLVPKSGVN